MFVERDAITGRRWTLHRVDPSALPCLIRTLGESLRLVF